MVDWREESMIEEEEDMSLGSRRERNRKESQVPSGGPSDSQRLKFHSVSQKSSQVISASISFAFFESLISLSSLEKPCQDSLQPT